MVSLLAVPDPRLISYQFEKQINRTVLLAVYGNQNSGGEVRKVHLQGSETIIRVYTSDDNNNKVEGNDREIKQLQEKLNQHNELVIEALKELTKNVSSIKEEVGKPTSNPLKLQKYEEQLKKQKKSIDEKDQQIAEIKNQVNICAKNLKSYEEKLVYSECTDIADSPGIHKIKPDQEEPFDVLCDSATAGPGWTVIQQRINGKENFNRDWKTYRAGFGDFVGDFFLGLENIHRLTNSQPHELYIYMEDFDGIIKYYRYEQFTIAGEDDLYRLRISDKAVGNATKDALIYLNYQQFTTFDRDNDVDVYANCAKDYGGGWWYRFCIRRYSLLQLNSND
ncbi:angiopoietin-related protein 7 [Drosophila virilis]|uniref:Fibrinogen C-terminal domain-containing protein n=1 Tax=Drosophila virilis TaxID=7244 RepID=B4LC53_DROVI|nr:angiopoietin-related protein 7 [Drosophila virilis]EDW70881.2 uncharacterized protein Dvir_GJ14027 [Drosophila virilis]